MHRWRQHGLDLVLSILAGMRAVVSGDPRSRAYHQGLFAQAECFVQVANVLNGDCPEEAGVGVAAAVLGTLTALMAGNEGARRRFRCGGFLALHPAAARWLLSQCCCRAA